MMRNLVHKILVVNLNSKEVMEIKNRINIIKKYINDLYQLFNNYSKV